MYQSMGGSAIRRSLSFFFTVFREAKFSMSVTLGLQIILESEIMASSVNDVTMLRIMLGKMKQQGLSSGPAVFNADWGYDSDYNCGMLFEMGMIPNIKQRIAAVNRGKPSRSRAAGLFNKDDYGQRGMIECIFGGEESKLHQLHCRFIRWDNHRHFGKIRAIAWNLKVLNRLRCARMLGIEIPSYGGVVCA